MKHCFHGNGTALGSYPEKYPQSCCFCGKQRIIQRGRFAALPGHGRFAPAPDWMVSIPDSEQPFAEEECPARVAELQPA